LIAASASTPLWSGIERSMRITSTSPFLTMSTASRPFPASATTVKSTCSEKYWRNPVRTIAWSSMMAILIMVVGC
jgi:hypothetical protein